MSLSTIVSLIIAVLFFCVLIYLHTKKNKNKSAVLSHVAEQVCPTLLLWESAPYALQVATALHSLYIYICICMRFGAASSSTRSHMVVFSSLYWQADSMSHIYRTRTTRDLYSLCLVENDIIYYFAKSCLSLTVSSKCTILRWSSALLLPLVLTMTSLLHYQSLGQNCKSHIFV